MRGEMLDSCSGAGVCPYLHSESGFIEGPGFYHLHDWKILLRSTQSAPSGASLDIDPRSQRPGLIWGRLDPRRWQRARSASKGGLSVFGSSQVPKYAAMPAHVLVGADISSHRDHEVAAMISLHRTEAAYGEVPHRCAVSSQRSGSICCVGTGWHRIVEFLFFTGQRSSIYPVAVCIARTVPLTSAGLAAGAIVADAAIVRGLSSLRQRSRQLATLTDHRRSTDQMRFSSNCEVVEDREQVGPPSTNQAIPPPLMTTKAKR